MGCPLKPTSSLKYLESSCLDRVWFQGGSGGTFTSLLSFSYKFPHLQNCFSSGESLLIDTLENWRAQTGLDIREFYGQTETVSAPRGETNGLVHLVGFERLSESKNMSHHLSGTYSINIY